MFLQADLMKVMVMVMVVALNERLKDLIERTTRRVFCMKYYFNCVLNKTVRFTSGTEQKIQLRVYLFNLV